jgi:hypothetical protein
MADDGSTMDRWLAAVARELEVDALDRDGTRLLLDVTRDVAHGVARPAAPLTSYLLGLAVGAGADPAEASARVTALAEAWDKPDDD